MKSVKIVMAVLFMYSYFMAVEVRAQTSNPIVVKVDNASVSVYCEDLPGSKFYFIVPESMSLATINSKVLDLLPSDHNKDFPCTIVVKKHFPDG